MNHEHESRAPASRLLPLRPAVAFLSSHAPGRRPAKTSRRGHFTRPRAAFFSYQISPSLFRPRRHIAERSHMSKRTLVGFVVAVAGVVGTLVLALTMLANLRVAAGL